MPGKVICQRVTVWLNSWKWPYQNWFLTYYLFVLSCLKSHQHCKWYDDLPALLAKEELPRVLFQEQMENHRFLTWTNTISLARYEPTAVESTILTALHGCYITKKRSYICFYFIQYPYHLKNNHIWNSFQSILHGLIIFLFMSFYTYS